MSGGVCASVTWSDEWKGLSLSSEAHCGDTGRVKRQPLPSGEQGEHIRNGTRHAHRSRGANDNYQEAHWPSVGQAAGGRGAAVFSMVILSQVHPECHQLPQLEGENLCPLTLMPKPWCSKHPAIWWQEVQPFRESLFVSILRCFREVPCDTKPPCPVVYNYKPSPRPNSTPDVSLLGAHSIASILPLPSPWLHNEAQSQWLRRLPTILPPLVLSLLQCDRKMLWAQRGKQRLISGMLSSWSKISSPPLDRLREGLHHGPHPQWLCRPFTVQEDTASQVGSSTESPPASTLTANLTLQTRNMLCLTQTLLSPEKEFWAATCSRFFSSQACKAPLSQTTHMSPRGWGRKMAFINMPPLGRVELVTGPDVLFQRHLSHSRECILCVPVFLLLPAFLWLSSLPLLSPAPIPSDVFVSMPLQ